MLELDQSLSKVHGSLPGNLPREIWLEIASYLSLEDLLNLIRTNTQLTDNDYKLMLSCFSDSLVSDEVIAHLAGDSRIKFENNRERFLFLKANLIDPISRDIILYNDPNKDADTVKLYTGHFANKDFLDILLKLNCWKLISTELLKKYNVKNLTNFALNAINYNCLFGFSKIIEALDYNSLNAIFREINRYEDDLPNPEATRILIAAAKRKTDTRPLFSLSPLRLAVFDNDDLEFDKALNSNKIENEATFEETKNFDYTKKFYKSRDILKRNFKALFLYDAIVTKQHGKLKSLLSRFKDILNQTEYMITIGQYIVLACEKGDLEAVKIILGTFPELSAKEEFISSIILELTKNEISHFNQTCFEYLLQQYKPIALTQGKQEFFQAFMSLYNVGVDYKTEKMCHFFRVLQILLNFEAGFFVHTLDPLLVEILTQNSNAHWDNRSLTTKETIAKNVFQDISPLLTVVICGNKAALRWLLKHELNVNQRYVFHKKRNANALYFAIKNKLIPLETRLDLIEQLLQADIEATKIFEFGGHSPSDSNALRAAIDTHEPEIVSKICSYPAVQRSSQTYERFAAFNTNDIKIVKEVSPLFHNRNDNVLTLIEKPDADIAILPFLQNAVSDINAEGGGIHSYDQDRDATYHAIDRGRLDILTFLSAHGANLSKLYTEAFNKKTLNTLYFALYNNFFNIAEFLIQRGIQIIPNHAYLFEQEYSQVHLEDTRFLLPIFQLLFKKQFRLLELALDVIKKSNSTWEVSSLCDTYFRKPRSHQKYAPTLGVNIIYIAVISHSPIALIERLIDDFKINLNRPYMDENYSEGPSLLHALIKYFGFYKNFHDYFVSILPILIKKGANTFQIYRGQDVFTSLATCEDLHLRSDLIKEYTSKQLNYLFLKHIKLLKDPVFASEHENMGKNLHAICSSQQFNLNLSKLSMGDYIRMMLDILKKTPYLSYEKIFDKIYTTDALQALYYSIAFDLPYDANIENHFYQLLTDSKFDPNKVINMHHKKDNVSKDKVILSLLRLMDKIFTNYKVSINTKTLRFFNSYKQSNNKTNKISNTLNSNENTTDLQREIAQLAEKLYHQFSSQSLQTSSSHFQPNSPKTTVTPEKFIDSNLSFRQR